MGAMEDENKALLDAALEREEIVKRYDRGRDPDAPIDAWEDPAFEVYHITDRYGFMHDSRLPQHDKEEKAGDEKESERVDKWRKMNSDWKKYYGSEKLKTRVYKGIPNRWRGEIWKRLLLVDEVKSVSKYEEMRDRARSTSPDIRQIDLDVNRTYRNHIMFRERYGTKQKHLFHVLAAYSMYNTEVGYCQGMSQIAALLLMYMDEEDAFWSLHQLLTNKKHAMHGLFIPGFPKLLRYQEHFEHVLKKFLPKIYKFMNANMIPPSLYAIKWFMQCFLDRTPFTLTLRLYDVYMLEGEKILIPMSFLIFKLHKQRLLKMPMEQFVQYLQQDLEKDFGFEDDIVINNELRAAMDKLRSSRVIVPPKPKPNVETPQKAFGTITFPTLEELRKRQAEQLHLNDNPQPQRKVSLTLELAPKHARTLTSQDSFASDYDNHPGKRSSIPTDSNKDLDDADVTHAQITSQPSTIQNHKTVAQISLKIQRPPDVQRSPETQKPPDMERSLSTQKLPSPLKTSVARRPVLESHLPLQGSPIIAQRHSGETEEVELRLDLSDEDSPCKPGPPKMAGAVSQQVYMERLPDDRSRESSRSSSKSPDANLENGSHMYVRSAGFRGKQMSPCSDRASPKSNSMSPTMRQQPSPSPRSSINPSPRLYSPSSEGRQSADNVRSIQPVSLDGYRLYDDQANHTYLQGNGSVVIDHRPISPNDRPAYNPGYLSESLRRKPVLANHPAASTSHRRPEQFYAVSHVVRQPTPHPIEPNYSSRIIVGDHSNSSRPAPVTHINPTFHTFGGHPARSPPNQLLVKKHHQNSHQALSFGMDSGSPISPPPPPPVTAQTLPPRPVYQQTGNGKHHKQKFYVVSEPATRARNAASSRSPMRYQFSDEDENHPPIFL